MWWYRDQKKNGSAERAPAAAPVEAGEPDPDFEEALAAALDGRAPLPAGLLAMSVLVDHDIHMADGTLREALSWQEAETAVVRALGTERPARLYNHFARELGDGYSQRADLPDEHAQILREFVAALLRSPAISSLETRD